MRLISSSLPDIIVFCTRTHIVVQNVMFLHLNYMRIFNQLNSRSHSKNPNKNLQSNLHFIIKKYCVLQQNIVFRTYKTLCPTAKDYSLHFVRICIISENFNCVELYKYVSIIAHGFIKPRAFPDLIIETYIRVCIYAYIKCQCIK